MQDNRNMPVDPALENAAENVTESAADFKLSMPVKTDEVPGVTEEVPENVTAKPAVYQVVGESDLSEDPLETEESDGPETSRDEEPAGRYVRPRKKSGSSRVYAGFFVRLTAYLLDKVIVGVPLVLLRMILMIFLPGSSADFLARKVFFSFTVLDVMLYLLTIVYFVLLTYYFGGTVGKKMMKLRVVSAEDRKPTFFEIAFREIIGRYLSAFILYIGYLIIGAGEQKEALHDYLADTRVVYELGA